MTRTDVCHCKPCVENRRPGPGSMDPETFISYLWRFGRFEGYRVTGGSNQGGRA